jgi:hypothetical protein
MAKYVEVKDVGLVEFPDETDEEKILRALRSRFSYMDTPMPQTIEPYEPTLAERTQSGIANFLGKTGLVRNPYQAQRVGENVSTLLNAAPIVGDAFAGDELGRAAAQGDAAGVGLAALGAIPIIGDAARAAGAGAKDLYKVSNITKGGLGKAEELGGMASPSVAVARQGAGFDSYGDISLIGERSAFSKDPTFASDIYSARFPEVELDIDRKALEAEAGAISGTVPKAFNDVSRSFYPESLTSDRDWPLERSTANKYAFLRQKGIEIDPSQFTRVYEQAPRKMPPLFDEFYGESARPLTLPTIISDAEFGGKADRFLTDIARKSNYNKMDLFPDFYTDGQINRDGRIFVAKEIKADRDASSIRPPTIDFVSANKALDDAVKQFPDEWANYLAAQKSRLVKSKYFPKTDYNTGERKRVAYTLNNAVRMMRSPSVRNQEGYSYGVGNIRAEVTPQLRSLDEIQNRRGQIISDEEMGAVKDKFNKELDSLYQQLSGAWAYDSPPSIGDFADEIANYARGDRSGFRFTPEQSAKANQFFDNLKEAPTQYFEIKPQRAVDLSEFYGAAIPEDTPEEVVRQLESKGLQIVKYSAGNRQEAIKKLDEISGGKILFSGAGALMLFGAASNSDNEDGKPI